MRVSSRFFMLSSSPLLSIHLLMLFLCSRGKSFKAHEVKNRLGRVASWFSLSRHSACASIFIAPVSRLMEIACMFPLSSLLVPSVFCFIFSLSFYLSLFFPFTPHRINNAVKNSRSSRYYFHLTSTVIHFLETIEKKYARSTSHTRC